MSTESTYHVTYRVEPHPEPLPREHVPDGWGAADALALISIKRLEDGSISYSMIGLDGKSASPMTDVDLLKAWCAVSGYFASRDTIAEPFRELAQTVSDGVRRILQVDKVPS